jgi:D-glycero-D-manno-heptose 1,7-bisphosphate phosphatase
MARTPAVFVDRDGTLNREVDYLRRVSDLRLLPGAAAAVRALSAAGFAVVVVTNQSGVARGLIDPATLTAIHRTLERRLVAAGGRLAGLYVCPHHPEAGMPPLRRRCRCRKPAPGLVHRAVRELDLDLARSYCVGDTAADLGLAAATGTRGVLVLTGHGRRTAAAPAAGAPAAHVARNFRAAAEWIIDDARRKPRRRR